MFAAVLALNSPSAFGQLVYTNSFTTTPGSEWSLRSTSVTPNGARRFLGPFATGTTSLTLTNLPPHAEVTLAFDLFILLTWDGIGDSDNGPDVWTLSVAGGPTLVRASFLNTFLIDKNSAQSYPDDTGSGLHDGRTGAVENNTLGYSWSGRSLDSVYHLAFSFPHTASSVVLNFAGVGLQAVADEGWGLDNVAVYAGPIPPVITVGPQNQYAALGDNAMFAVRAAGSVDLNYQWFFHGTPILAQTNATLSITNVQFTDTGAYTVRVSNPFSSVLSPPASLTVFGARPEKLWEFATRSGISCPPALGRDGTIYVGSVDGRLYALDTNGSNKWSFLTPSPVVSSPSVGVSDQIYFSSRDGKFYALKANGSNAWARSINSQDCSPALGADETIYEGTQNGSLYAYLPNGNGRWVRTAGGGWIESSAAVAADGTIYVGAPDGRLYAKTTLGASRWTYPTAGAVDSSPAIGSDGTIYVGSSDGRLYALSPTGTNKWSFATKGAIESSPAIGLDGTIYVGSGDGRLYAINPSGSEKWEFATDVPVASSPAISADGTIYFGPVSGNVFALYPDGVVKWVFPIGVGVFGASPALTLDGTLYVCGSNKVYALKTSSGLARSSWPMFRHDPRHTANAGLPFVFPPTLFSPTLQSDGQFTIDVYGEAGSTYQIAVSGDLNSWSVLTNLSATTFHTLIADPQAASYQQRFYRARLFP